MRRFHHSLSVSLVAAAMLLALGVAVPAAQAQECGVPIDVGIANSGFEVPNFSPPTGVRNPNLADWTVGGADAVVLWSANNTLVTFTSGTQHIGLGSAEFGSGSVSQALDGATLAGTTVTFTIISKFSGTVTLGDQSQSISGSSSEQTHTVSFEVPAGTTGSLTLTLSSATDWRVDQISGTYVVPCPSDPVSTEECRDGGWADFGFRNQGQCVRFVNTGADSR